MILATSKSSKCLRSYLFICEEPLKSLLYVETGHSDRLVIDNEAWENFPEENKKIILVHIDGFVSGWEAREDWEDYE
jgi:hypothetical protein